MTTGRCFRRAGSFASTAVFGLCLSVSSALAQEESTGGARQSGAVEEIIVTTQRRAESLQAVPLAVSAFSGESLREQRLFNLKDISDRTPGLTIGAIKPGTPTVFIRGIGTRESGAAADPAVVLFIDEVYMGRMPGLEMDLLGLARVEVLRGPQGTLFGKNVVGGAINIVTAPPADTPEAEVELSVGNFEALSLRGYASGPLTERLSGKISFGSRTREGFIRSVAADLTEFYPLEQRARLENLRRGRLDSVSGRGSLRWLPTESVEVNLSADYARRNETGQALYYLPGAGNGGDFYRSDVLIIPGYRENIHTHLFDEPGAFTLDMWGGAARVDVDLASDMVFTSLTGVRRVESYVDDILGSADMARVRLATGAVPFSFVGNNPAAETSEVISQELRLTSDSGGSLEWVAGLYLLREDVSRAETSNLGLVVSDGAGGLINFVPQVLGGEEQFNRTNSYAIFGQGAYRFTDAMRLTVGARFTRDEKKGERVATAGGLVVRESFVVETSASWSEFTPKVTLDYQFTDDLFAYLTASKGFKSGGWQRLAPTRAVAETPFDQETAWLYEFGLKSEWLDNRIRLNAAVFYTDYKDLQVAQGLIPESSLTETPVLYTQNAANAAIKGVEVEYTMRLWDSVTLGGSYAYLDSEFSDFFVPDGFRLPLGAPPVESREGNELPRAPRHSISALAAYERQLATGASFRGQLDWRYVSRNFGDPDNLDFGSIPAYSATNARLAYFFPSGSLEMALWVDNLFDKKYFAGNFPNAGSGWASPAPPRMYGMTVNWRL